MIGLGYMGGFRSLEVEGQGEVLRDGGEKGFFCLFLDGFVLGHVLVEDDSGSFFVLDLVL